MALMLIMLFLLGSQLSMDGLRAVFDESGFSIDLLAYAFVSGAVFLFFGTYFVHVTMLLVSPDRRQRAWARLSGKPAPSVAREYGDAMAQRLTGGPLNAAAAVVLVLHAVLLGLNARFAWVSSGLMINASIVLIAGLGMFPYQWSPSTKSS